MKNLILILSAIILLTGCGSTYTAAPPDLEGTKCEDVGAEADCSADCGEGTQICEDDGFWGECVCEDASTGGTGGSDNTGGTEPGTGGGNTETGGSSGSTGGSDNTGGTSTGGTDNTGGNDPGTGGADNTGGTGGAGCVPKTCEEVTVELTGTATEQGELNSACGSFDDGCGGELDCSCTYAEDCGHYIPDNSESVSEPEGTPQESNLCGGGCTEITSWAVVLEQCGVNPIETPDGPKLFSCSDQYPEERTAEVVGMTTCTLLSQFSSGWGLVGFCCE